MYMYMILYELYVLHNIHYLVVLPHILGLSTYSTCILPVCVHYQHIPLMAHSDLLRRDRNNVDAIFVKAMCFYYQVLL